MTIVESICKSPGRKSQQNVNSEATASMGGSSTASPGSGSTAGSSSRGGLEAEKDNHLPLLIRSPSLRKWVSQLERLDRVCPERKSPRRTTSSRSNYGSMSISSLFEEQRRRQKQLEEAYDEERGKRLDLQDELAELRRKFNTLLDEHEKQSEELTSARSEVKKLKEERKKNLLQANKHRKQVEVAYPKRSMSEVSLASDVSSLAGQSKYDDDSTVGAMQGSFIKDAIDNKQQSRFRQLSSMFGRAPRPPSSGDSVNSEGISRIPSFRRNPPIPSSFSVR